MEKHALDGAGKYPPQYTQPRRVEVEEFRLVHADRSPSRSFSFLHIHLNLYQSTQDALVNLFPCLTRGGIVLIEDYGLHTCAGAKSAADEFFANGRNRIIHLPTGQGVVFKND